MPPVKTIAVINQKGGVGKTTSVANLGAALAARGNRVCLIDMDPQSHLTLHFGIEPGSTPASIYDVLTADVSLDKAAIDLPGRDRIRLVPSVIDLAASEVELAGTVGREQILRERIGEASDLGDYVLIDCPPSLSVLALNSLAAASSVIIPLQPQFLALQGLGKLLETIRLVQQRINSSLRVTGVILCMYDATTKLTGEVVDEVTAFFASGRGTKEPWADAKIFQSVIRRNIKLAECPSHGKTIFEYAPGSRGAEDYEALAAEVLACFEPAAVAPQTPVENPQPAEEQPRGEEEVPRPQADPAQPEGNQAPPQGEQTQG